MKQDILKIAGVKSEAEFYKKFPSEEAFMKVHGKEFKKAKMGTAMVKKQLTQLTDFANPPQAEDGDEIPKYQYSGTPLRSNLQKPSFMQPFDFNATPYQQYQPMGLNPYMGLSGGMSEQFIGEAPSQYRSVNFDYSQPMGAQFNPNYGGTRNNATYNNQTGMFNSSTGQVSMADTRDAGFYNNGNKTIKRTIQDLDANEINSGIQMTSMIGKNVQKIGNAIENKKKAKQLNALAPVIAQAAGTRPERLKNKYVRPEDMMFDPNQMFPSYGTGTNVLAANGAMVGGNPTEIQNMYNPGDLYSDLGYEPLNDSDKVKQYKKGGNIPKAAMGIGDMMAIGTEAGNMLGDATAGIINMGTNRLNKQNQQMLGQAGFQSGMQSLQQNQYGAFMEDGGWVSNDWQPQTITKFGGYNVKDLLREDPMMDTLRAGGNVGKVDYTAPSQRAMSTERMAMGGELQTHWGGYAEPISYNPYLPDGGVTMMPRGQSHEESDGQGNTGIGITFGNNPVEVERGEPMVKLKDGGDQESLVVYGNMKIPSYGLSELNDSLAKGKKFKNYANLLSKKESKQNKIVEKGTELINNSDPNDSFDLLKLNSAQSMVMGGNMKLKKYADKKILLSGIQNAILDTAKELGVESDALSKGKIKQDKNSDMAKFGGKFTKAQNGTSKSKYDPEFESFIDQAMQLEQANSSQSGDYRGGGNYFGTNNAAYNTPEKAKEYYFKKYWSKVKDLPPGLRTRALQMAINTGDPYGELMVAAGTMGYARRRDSKNERKDKSIVGNADWEAYGKKVLKQYNEDPQAFLAKLDAEQNRYYNSLVEANTNADGKTFGSIDPNTSREFYDDYLGLAKFAAEPFIKKPTLQQAIQQAPQQLPTAPTSAPQVAQQSSTPMQPSRTSIDQRFPSPVDESGNYYMPGYQPYGQEVPAAPMNKSNGRDFVQQKYQNPSNIDPLMNRWSSLLESVQNRTQPVTMPERYLGVNKPEMTAKLPAYVQNMESSVDRSEDVSSNDKDKKKFDYMKVLRELQPYLIPSNQEPLDPNQLSGEMLALANNQLQPVQAQQYTPQLETPYSVSFQDQMNANQADFNAMQRQYGYNPAAASQLAAQKYAANSAILGQQARANQEMQMGAYNRNRGVLNDSTIKNLAILDQQYQRQEQAKSNTKMQAQVALNSIADKIAKNKLENKTLGVMENMYNYRFGPKGRAYNVNAPYEFNMEGSQASSGMPTLPEGYEYSTEIRQKKKTKGDSDARNGSIVKAIKNL